MANALSIAKVKLEPLRGVKVVEIVGIGPGPFAGVFLAELGAEVTLIKRPDPETRDDPLERGKRTVLLDLKSDEGRAHLLGLAATKAPTSASPRSCRRRMPRAGSSISRFSPDIGHGAGPRRRNEGRSPAVTAFNGDGTFAWSGRSLGLWHGDWSM